MPCCQLEWIFAHADSYHVSRAKWDYTPLLFGGYTMHANVSLSSKIRGEILSEVTISYRMRKYMFAKESD